jgi:hypothetical protein
MEEGFPPGSSLSVQVVPSLDQVMSHPLAAGNIAALERILT